MSSNEQSGKKDNELNKNISPKKDEKKKKKDSGDKKENEKRVDSVTGSPLDTSSSSNSSVDSDELDTSEHNGSKNAMISVASGELQSSTDKHNIDGTLGEVIKKIAAISNTDLSDVSRLTTDEGNRKNGQMNNADNGKEGVNGKTNNAKKSRKRNRKQRKKIKNKLNQNELLPDGLEFSHTVENDASRNSSQALSDCVDWKLGVRMTKKLREPVHIDGMEAANLLYMIDAGNTFAQQFTKWLQNFYTATVDGNAEEFTSRFTCILRIIEKRSECYERFQHMSQSLFKERIMQAVVVAFFDKSENTSVLHHLAATKNVDCPCEMKSHGCCRLIRIILSTLPWEDRKTLLATCTKRTGKTALHIAAATGQSCQLQALMDFGAWPDWFDHSGRAPIHYAITRNNLEMVKLLLWYGADISLRERSATPLQLASCSAATMPICEYLHARLTALENIYMQWIQKYVRGVWTPVHAISDLHFLRLSKACDSRRDAIRNLATKTRKLCISFLETRASNVHLKKYPLMLLFVVPTFYKVEDRIADASNPQIFCAKLQNLSGTIVKLLPARPLLSSAARSVGIKSALEKPHNGYFYVYKLPEDLEIGSHTLHLAVELEEVRFEAPHIALAVQAFACGPPDLKHYNELRGLAESSNNKSKMD